jgi:flavin reductase (DIM6/NTAB) family NADH-FMN oxidoreductase RutF
MKKILLLLMMIPFLGFAQTPSKYLEGAVPVVDGKVTFTQSIRIPSKTKAEVYRLVDKWAQEQFKTDLSFPTNKLISEDASSGEIAALGEEYIIFAQGALSLDRSRIYYQFRAQCEDEKVTVSMTRIRYWYNEARDGGERYNAEELITDEFGLTKKKDKPARIIGKFRVKTIDYKDDLFKNLAKSITEQIQNPELANQTAAEKQKKAEEAAPSEIVIETKAPQSVATVERAADIVKRPIATLESADNTVAATAVVPAAAATVATVAPAAAATPATKAVPAAKNVPAAAAVPAAMTKAGSEFEGFRSIEASEIPGNIYELLSKHWMLITAGKADAYNTMTASWGGLGNLYQSPVAFCFINPARYTYRFMENNDTYTLTFFPDEYKSALKLLGTKSGRDGDKVKESGLTPVTTPSGNQTFQEASLIIECQKMVAQSLNPEALKDDALKQEWEGKAMHKMYIGKILRVWVK